MRHHIIFGNSQWRQISQSLYWNKYTDFKWTVFMAPIRSGEPVKWVLKGTKIDYSDVNHDMWSYMNKTDYVPLDKWFKYEIYVKYSTGSDGVIQVAVDDKVVLERKGWNQESANFPPENFRLTGTYGARGWMQTTDLELWDKPPVDSILSPKFNGNPWKGVVKDSTVSSNNMDTSVNSDSESTTSPNSAGKFIMKPGVLE